MVGEIAITRDRRGQAGATLPMLGLSALGVVFGDIGTSPLYTLNTVLDLAGGKADPATALGALSLILWTLVIVTSIKYVSVAMRADNDGEGGVFALYGLLHRFKNEGRRAVLWSLMLGAGLLFGDGMITPAISVLSAVEGLEVATPALSPLAVYLRANLLTLKRLPDFAGIIPQDVAAIAEESPEAGVVYLLDANQQILGWIRALQERGVVVQGKYVYAPAHGALSPATPFELDLSKPVSLQSASLAPASGRPMQRLEPTLMEPIRPAMRPSAAEPMLVEPLRPAIRPTSGIGMGR